MGWYLEMTSGQVSDFPHAMHPAGFSLSSQFTLPLL
jgi:hypothetical protein